MTPKKTDPTDRVLAQVAAERRAQDEKWGEQNHPDGSGLWMYQSASARFAKEACQKRAAAGNVAWVDILEEEVREAFAEKDPAMLRAELVQVAAVVVAWVEAIDRRAVDEVPS